MVAESRIVKKIKVGLVCGPGGHYAHMKILEEAISGFHYFYITIDSIVTHEIDNSYLFRDIPLKRRIDFLKIALYYLVIFTRSFRILIKEKPKVLVSTGGEGVLPVFYAGKMLGIKLLHIEPSTRYEKPSMTGRLIYPIVDRLFVQNPELLQAYGKKAEYHGGLL